MNPDLEALTRWILGRGLQKRKLPPDMTRFKA